MKKLMMGLMVAGLMSTGLMAGVGKITSVRATDDGKVYLTLQRTSDSGLATSEVVGTAEAVKAMIAIALTAKTTNSTVEVFYGTYGGISGWRSVNIQ